MVPPVEVLTDSSLLIEYVKETKTELLEFLAGSETVLYINSAVLSEFFYHYVAVKGKKSPLSLKSSRQIGDHLEHAEYSVFLQQFGFLEAGARLVEDVPRLMKKHNLLPNDALILATCLSHKIPYLASYDVNDFASACADEGIVLLSDEQEAKRHIPSV